MVLSYIISFMQVLSTEEFFTNAKKLGLDLLFANYMANKYVLS